MTTPNSPINTVLLSEFQPFTDQYGMITDNKLGNTSGNGNLYTAYYVFGLFYKKLLPQERDRLLQVYKNNFIQPGLYCCNPNFPGDREAQDDGFGIMLADAFLNPETRDMTNSILSYGQNVSSNGIDLNDPNHATWNKWLYWPLKIMGLGKIKYVWNNISPNTFSADSWLGRFCNLTATMELASKKWVNPLLWAYWAIWMLAMYVSSNDNNAYALKWCSAMAVEGHGPITNFICKLLYKRVDKEFGSVSGLLNSYFNNPANPIVPFLADIKYY